MKYVVIKLYNREIKKVGVANTLIEAKEIMQNDFMNVFVKEYNIDDFENGVDRGEEWDLSEYYGCAWLRGSNDYDWEIIEVE